MNILILNWRDPYNPKSGGAEIVTLEHAKAWIKKGHDVTWFTSRFSGSLFKERKKGIYFVRLGNSFLVYFFAPFYYFLSRKKFDVVIDEIHGIPFFTPLYVRVPKIAFIHEVASNIWDYMYPFPLNLIGKISERVYFLFYRNTIFWTDAESTIKDLIKLGIKRENCTAIYCPAQNKTIKSLPKKEKVATFIFVSRVVRMKGIEDVIKSFFYILKELKEGNLWIIGSGDEKYFNYLKKIISNYSIESKVKFFGKISERRKLTLMKKAHLLLHASIREGWGLVVIEAASQGTPSIVYGASGLKDSVLDKKTGIVLKRNTPIDMAKYGLKVFKNKKEYLKLQKNGIQWAKSLTWKDASKKSLELIENVKKK